MVSLPSQGWSLVLWLEIEAPDLFLSYVSGSGVQGSGIGALPLWREANEYSSSGAIHQGALLCHSSPVV